jgi:hypothetical protein
MTGLRPAVVLCLCASFLACTGDDPAGPAGLEAAFNANGAGTCQSFRAEGISYAVGPTTFSGSAQAWIGGVAVPVSVVTELTGAVGKGQPAVDAKGAQVVTTSHHFDFGAGNTISTEDMARLIPTSTDGLFKLVSTLRITSATGTFAGAAGNSNASFTTDPSSAMDMRAWPTVTWSFDTRLCGYSG